MGIGENFAAGLRCVLHPLGTLATSQYQRGCGDFREFHQIGEWPIHVAHNLKVRGPVEQVMLMI